MSIRLQYLFLLPTAGCTAKETPSISSNEDLVFQIKTCLFWIGQKYPRIFVFNNLDVKHFSESHPNYPIGRDVHHQELYEL